MNRFGLLLISFSLLTGATSYAETQMLEPKNCFRGPFESYERWAGVLKKNKPGFNEKAFQQFFPAEKFNQRKADLDCTDFTYQSDDFNVEGFYLAPKSPEKPLPVVIFNRGGNASFGYVVFGTKMDLPAELASEGYIVLGSQYRGASRRVENNGKDEFGGADVNDVLALIDIAKSLPHADTSRIALVGWSRGVMQSYLAAKHLTDVKAIVSVAGNADLKQAVAWRPEMEKVYAARMPDYATNKAQLIHERSVINWIDKLPPAPILMLHGTADTRVNVEQSRLMASALNAANHTNKLVTFEGDNHGLSQHRTAAYAEIKDWLQQYLVAR